MHRMNPGTRTDTTASSPKIGFVSLGCPKALTDSELILTQLRAEGYDTSKTYAGADLVIVNTCGFIDDAVKESLVTIGEALAANGKVIVTGCLGARAAEGGGNLTVEQKRRICEKHRSTPKITQKDLCRWAKLEFNLKKAPTQPTMSNILKQEVLTNKSRTPRFRV